MSFFDELQPGSFRGVPFGVLGAESRFGRRVAVHEYPFRDTPWIEDIGRGTRKITFTAFLIEDSLVYGGGSVLDQRDAMIAACETEGAGTLIHPTLGRLTVSVPEDGLGVIERWDEGRFFEISFLFIESGERVFPVAPESPTDDANDAADATDTASGNDFAAAATPALDEGSAVVHQALETATAFADSIALHAADATSLFTMLATLPGNYGRFFPGGTVGFAGVLTVAGAPTTVSGLILAAAAARSAVAEANLAFLGAAATTDPLSTASSAQAAVAALLAATVDPAVAIRLLTALQGFYPAAPTTGSPIGLAMASMQTAMGNLCRRGALASLVRSAALYQPPSRDAAAQVRDNLGDLLNAEILVAGDSGDDASYSALRVLRSTMIVDLNTRGAALAPMKVFNFAAPLPALALAQQLYQDATRNDELALEANPPHPAFMPVSFSALAS